MKAVVLAGGTGGAKLAAGAQDLLGEDLSVVVNTGDDAEVLGVHVSPDPDLVTYWLCGEIDSDRGWGIRGDRFTVMERMVRLGAPEWFRISDLDLATCLRRRSLLDAGARQTEAQLAIAAALGARARVLPMSDQPVRGRVRTAGGWLELQEYLVRERCAPDVLELAFDGLDAARPTPEVAAALDGADAIVIGPSNPVLSIGPILSVPGMREAIGAAEAPVVAVSPYVGGRVVKGPTDAFMRAAGLEPGAAGAIAFYGELLDGAVVDAGDPEPPTDGGSATAATAGRPGPAVLRMPTLMDSPDARRAVAKNVLDFATSLG